MPLRADNESLPLGVPVFLYWSFADGRLFFE